MSTVINGFINCAAYEVRLCAHGVSRNCRIVSTSTRVTVETIRGDVIALNIVKEKSEIREIRVDSCASVSYVACITLVTRPKFAEGRSYSSNAVYPHYLSTHPLSSISFDRVPLIGPYFYVWSTICYIDIYILYILYIGQQLKKWLENNGEAPCLPYYASARLLTYHRRTRFQRRRGRLCAGKGRETEGRRKGNTKACWFGGILTYDPIYATRPDFVMP